MLKLFQTGDNHIGLKYASHEQREQLVSARIEAFKPMVETANKEQCDLFVITGDLFENTYGITKKEVAAVLDILAIFRGMVIVLPGNHDYYDKDVKVWQYFRELAASKDNIMLLTEYRPYPLSIGDNKVILYPAHCTSLHSQAGKNNLSWIKSENIPQDSSYKIGIAHGAVQGETIDKEGLYFLMTRQELEAIPMDLWLLGHTHVPFPSNITEQFSECGRILNAGTHMQTDVSCGTEGVCFIVEIDKDKSVKAKKVKTGPIQFYRKSILLTAGKMEEILSRELNELPDSSVVDLILSGAVTAEEYDERDSLLTKFLARFIEGTYSDTNMSKLISKELIDTEFAETSFSGGLLTALLNEPKEAQLAYELLKTLKEKN